ncbi:hypothetical protein HL736_001219, partial [Campylobacter lari]|nr:hypothetical protein [Campylobacter lari]
MAFKKVNSIKLDNKENIKEFASKARGETGIIKDEFTKQPRKPRKQENHKNKFRYQFFCDQELKTQINNEKLESTSLFLRNIFFNKNEIFQDKNIVEIFFLAKKEGLSISSFIRKKLNLSHQDEKFNYDS